MADNLKGIPISSLPKADELVADDQLIAYREDNGKAYRANVGTLGEAAESNLSDAFSTSKTYSAGEYVIYNDTLWKFTADKDAGEWDESVVEKTTMGTEIGEINQSLSDFNIIKAGDSISFVDLVTPIVIYNQTVYGRFNIGCPISATNVSWTFTAGTGATIRGQGNQYSEVDFSDASFGSLEIDEFGGVYFRFTTSNLPSGMSNYQIYLAWLRGTLTFS